MFFIPIFTYNLSFFLFDFYLFIIYLLIDRLRDLCTIYMVVYIVNICCCGGPSRAMKTSVNPTV